MSMSMPLVLMQREELTVLMKERLVIIPVHGCCQFLASLMKEESMWWELGECWDWTWQERLSTDGRFLWLLLWERVTHYRASKIPYHFIKKDWNYHCLGFVHVGIINSNNMHDPTWHQCLDYDSPFSPVSVRLPGYQFRPTQISSSTWNLNEIMLPH